MIKRTLILLLAFIHAVNAFGQVDEYYRLYQKKSFPDLWKQLGSRKTDDVAAKVFKASVLSAYGDYDRARGQLKKAGKALRGNLNDTLRFVSLVTELEIASHRKEYRNAVAASSELLGNYRHWMPEDEYEEETEALKIHRIARDVPAQTLKKKGDTHISLTRDIAGLMNLPVTLADTTVDFVFDSGAGMSVIAEKYAGKLGLHILSDSTVQVKSGSTGVSTAAKVGVADRIRIGNMEADHVLFLVFPDSALSFAGGRYEIRGIIGFPVMAAMEEVTLSGSDLFVPGTAGRKGSGRNMILYNHMPVVYLEYNGAELPFTFDTGANTSTLSHNFYGRFKGDLESSAVSRTEELHGVGGGSKKFNGLEVKKIELVSGNSVIELNDIFIMKEPFDANGDLFYGNIGKDVVNRFKSITFSFVNGAVFFNH